MFIKPTKAEIPGLRPRKATGTAREDFSLFTKDKEPPVSGKPALRDLTSDVEDAQVLSARAPEKVENAVEPKEGLASEPVQKAPPTKATEPKPVDAPKPEIVKSGGLSIKRTRRDPALDDSPVVPVQEDSSSPNREDTSGGEVSPVEIEHEAQSSASATSPGPTEVPLTETPPSATRPSLSQRWGKKREEPESLAEPTVPSKAAGGSPGLLYKVACIGSALAVLTGGYWAATGYLAATGSGAVNLERLAGSAPPIEAKRPPSLSDTTALSVDLNLLTLRAGDLWLPGTTVEVQATARSQQFDLTIDAAHPSPFTSEESLSSTTTPEGCQASLIETAHVQITCTSSPFPVVGSAAVRGIGADVAE